MSTTESILEQTRLNARNDLRIANNETKRLKHQAMAIAIAEANMEAEARAKIRKIDLLTASMLFVAVVKKNMGNAVGAALEEHVLNEFGFSTTKPKPIMHFISALVNSGKGLINIEHRSLLHQYRSIGGTLPSSQFLKELYAVLGLLLSRTLIGCCKGKTVYHLDLSLARDRIGNAYDPNATFPRTPVFTLPKPSSQAILDQNIEAQEQAKPKAKPKAKPRKPKGKKI